MKNPLIGVLSMGLALSACTKEDPNTINDTNTVTAALSTLDGGLQSQVLDQGSKVSEISTLVSSNVAMLADAGVLTLLQEQVVGVDTDNSQSTLTERDLIGVGPDVLSAGRAKFVRWRNMKIRRTFLSHNYSERPIIDSYEYKVMADFVFNYAEIIKTHYDGINSLNFNFLTNNSARYFTFSTLDQTLTVNVNNDTLFLTDKKTGRRKREGYNLTFTLVDENTGEKTTQNIDYTHALSDNLAQKFMTIFKQIIDSPAFVDEFNMFREADKLTSAKIPYYNGNVRSVGYYKSDRVFMDAACQPLDPYFAEKDQIYYSGDTPNAHLDTHVCFALAKPDSKYAKTFATPFDRLNGNYPVMFASKFPHLGNFDKRSLDVIKLGTQNVSVSKGSCSLKHLPIDNSTPYVDESDLHTTPWSFDRKYLGNMNTKRVYWLKFNGKIISPALYTFANFNNNRENNVPIATTADVKPGVCRVR